MRKLTEQNKRAFNEACDKWFGTSLSKELQETTIQESSFINDAFILKPGMKIKIRPE